MKDSNTRIIMLYWNSKDADQPVQFEHSLNCFIVGHRDKEEQNSMCTYRRYGPRCEKTCLCDF